MAGPNGKSGKNVLDFGWSPDKPFGAMPDARQTFEVVTKDTNGQNGTATAEFSQKTAETPSEPSYGAEAPGSRQRVNGDERGRFVSPERSSGPSPYEIPPEDRYAPPPEGIPNGGASNGGATEEGGWTPPGTIMGGGTGVGGEEPTQDVMTDESGEYVGPAVDGPYYQEPQEKKSNTGLIVGGVVAGVVALGGLAWVIFGRED